MKRFFSGVLTILCAGAFIAGAGASAIDAQKRATASAAQDTSAAGTAQTLDKASLELLVPSTYEQYLSLVSADGISLRDGYIAVADGKNVYVYNGAEYTLYTHTGDVVQLEWGEGHLLYFLDENGTLSTMDCTADEPVAEAYGLSCSSFTLADDTIYYAMSVTGTTNIYDARDRDNPIKKLVSPVTTVPCMVYENGLLYYTDGQYFNIFNPGTAETQTTKDLQTDIYDIAVSGNTLYYTDMNALYLYDIAAEKLQKTYDADDTAYGALCPSGNYMYVTGVTDKGAKICRFDTASGNFTDYEIGAASTSDNRLLSARQSIVAGEYLVTADENRLQLYNYTDGTFRSFPCAFTPAFLASDGNTILVANTSTVCVYDFDGKPVREALAGFNGNIAGVAAARDGDYFIVTENLSFYRMDADDFTRSPASTKPNSSRAKALTADIYGNLYVLFDDNAVYRYTPSEFMDNRAAGTLAHTFSAPTSDIAVDFDGNIYGLSGNALSRDDGAGYTIDNTECVFQSDATLKDFAFGYESGTVYFLYDDYILTTEAVDLPHLGALETGNAYETIYEERAGADDVAAVVTLGENAVLLRFELNELTEDAEYFPYLGYAREQTGTNALVLGKTDIHGLAYYIVSVFDPTTRTYTTGLVLQSACTAIDQEEYTSVPDRFTDGVGYVTNNVSLYKYPYLTGNLKLTALEKNTLVTVIRELSLGDALDYDYYFVSWSDGTQTLYGYVPKNFVRDFRGTVEENASVYYKTLHSDKDIVATSADNRQITLEAGKDYAVAAYTTEDEGKMLVAYEQGGVTYYATVDADSFREGSPDALRYFLVVLLLILDVILVVNYIVFKKKQ